MRHHKQACLFNGKGWLPGLIGCLIGVYFGTQGARAAAPKPEDALKYRPVQMNVDFDRPTKAETEKCTVKPEKIKGAIAWVVRDASGEILRKYTDTNGDKKVDRWSYFKEGLEVYRDMDTDYNGKADQFRWCNTGGTRWGIDKNEDGKIDTWKRISPEELAEEAVLAMRTSDAARFRRLLLSETELKTLGTNPDLTKSIQGKIRAAATGFAGVVSKQKVVTKKTTFVGYSGSKPGTIPSGTDGSTKDVTVYDNVVAFLETDGTHAQLLLGSLIQVEGAWKLFDLPQVGDASLASTSGQFFFTARSKSSSATTPGAEQGPSEEEAKLLSSLEKNERAIRTAEGKKRDALNEERIEVLTKLANLAKTKSEKKQWLRQLVDTVSAEAQSGSYNKGLAQLKKLQVSLEKQKGNETLIAHIVFRTLAAEYSIALQAPKAKYVKIQKQWLVNLEAFAKKYDTSPDAAEAMLQLGMAEEFSGAPKKALGWYTKVAKNFPSAVPTAKASGAIRRLQSVGKKISLQGNALGGGMVDLSEYRGKVVLVQYWATWCEPCKADTARLKEIYAKHASKGFAIVGVSLDNSEKELQQYVKKHRLPWKQLFEKGGLDSRPANQLGILTLPTMLLIGKDGKVIHRSIHVAELNGELKKLLK